MNIIKRKKKRKSDTHGQKASAEEDGGHRCKDGGDEASDHEGVESGSWGKAQNVGGSIQDDHVEERHREARSKGRFLRDRAVPHPGNLGILWKPPVGFLHDRISPKERGECERRRHTGLPERRKKRGSAEEGINGDVFGTSGNNTLENWDAL